MVKKIIHSRKYGSRRGTAIRSSSKFQRHLPKLVCYWAGGVCRLVLPQLTGLKPLTREAVIRAAAAAAFREDSVGTVISLINHLSMVSFPCSHCQNGLSAESLSAPGA